MSACVDRTPSYFHIYGSICGLHNKKYLVYFCESLSWFFSTKIEHGTWQQPIGKKSHLDKEIDNFSSNSTLSTNSYYLQTS